MAVTPRMKTLWQKTLSRLKEKLPEAPVRLVPSEVFFVRSVAIPEDVSPADIPSFLQLELEGLSPFPLEQLWWGYLHQSSDKHALLYATTRQRLEGLGFAADTSSHHLLPGFVVVLSLPFTSPTLRWLVDGDTLSLIDCQTGIVPAAVISRRFPAESLGDPETLRTAQANLRAELGATASLEASNVWASHGCTLNHQGELLCLLQDHAQPEAAIDGFPWPFPADSLWAADLRGVAFAQLERQRRRVARRCSRIVEAGGMIALGLIGIQILLWLIAGWTYLRHSKIERQDATVATINNRETLADRIRLTSEQDLKPFQMLRLVMSLRPKGIHLTRVTVPAFDRMEMEGESRSGVSPVNDFAAALLKSELVAEVQNSPRTDNGKTTFTMVLIFKPGANFENTAAAPSPKSEGGKAS